ncbi:hypothetical protein J6590_106649, partial [Homalodisca vitripennis]
MTKQRIESTKAEDPTGGAIMRRTGELPRPEMSFTERSLALIVDSSSNLRTAVPCPT